MGELVVPYDPEWPERFDEEADALREALGSEYLLLRDYLRSHPEEWTPYVDAKRAAEGAVGTGDPIGYWEHKREFVESLLERARA